MTTKQSKTESLEKKHLILHEKRNTWVLQAKTAKKKKTPENLVLVEMKNAML